MDIVSALEVSYDQTAKLSANLDRAGLAAPSPCAGWDVKAMMNHLVGAVWMFTLVNQGQMVGEDAGDVVGDDAAAAVVTATEANLASWTRPGAFDGGRSYPFGTFPARAGALINLEEAVVHNWDLAKATGQPLTIDANVAQMVYEFCQSLPLDDFRAHGAFGPEVTVSESAPLADRLVALLGRQP